MQSYAKRVCSEFAKLGARGVTLLFSAGDFGPGGVQNVRANLSFDQMAGPLTSFLRPIAHLTTEAIVTSSCLHSHLPARPLPLSEAQQVSTQNVRAIRVRVQSQAYCPVSQQTLLPLRGLEEVEVVVSPITSLDLLTRKILSLMDTSTS